MTCRKLNWLYARSGFVVLRRGRAAVLRCAQFNRGLGLCPF